jgi:hypothetical protein
MLFPSKIAKQTGGHGANWRALIAKRAGLSGVQWRQAISKLAGGSNDPVDWAEAVRSSTGVHDWQRGIVDLVSDQPFTPLD